VGRDRHLFQVKDGFLIIYQDTSTSPFMDFKRDVLKDNIPLTAIRPRHPLQDVWTAPFFYEDSRHIFFVTTTEQQMWIPDYTGYTDRNPNIGMVVKLPDMVFKTDPRQEVGPKFWGDG